MIQKILLMALIILMCVNFSTLYAVTHYPIDGEQKLVRYIEMRLQHSSQLSTLHRNRTFSKQQEQLKEVIAKIPKDRTEAIFNYFELLGLKKCPVNGFEYGASYQFMINAITKFTALSDRDFQVLIQFPHRQGEYNDHLSVAMLDVSEHDRSDVWGHSKRVYADHPDIAGLYNFDDIVRGVSAIPKDARSFMLDSSYKETKLSWLRITYNIRCIGDKEQNFDYYTTHMYQFIPFLSRASFVTFFYRYQLIWGKFNTVYSNCEWDVIKVKIDHKCWDCRLMPSKTYFDHALTEMEKGLQRGVFSSETPGAYDYLCSLLDTYICFQGCCCFTACVR